MPVPRDISRTVLWVRGWLSWLSSPGHCLLGMWWSSNSNSTTFELRTFSPDLKFDKCFKRFVVECEFVEKSLFYDWFHMQRQPESANKPVFYRAAWNADAVLRWEFCPSVRLSVRLSVKRVHCDKMKEKSVQIFTPYERSFIVVFWEKEWLVEGDPFYLKFWVSWPPLERNRWFWTSNRS